MILLAVVGRPYLVENEVSSSSVLSRFSKSSSVADGREKEARERLKKSIDVDARQSWRSNYKK